MLNQFWFRPVEDDTAGAIGFPSPSVGWPEEVSWLGGPNCHRRHKVLLGR